MTRVFALLFILIGNGVNFFNAQGSSFSYTDASGNNITIQNCETLPWPIDTAFLKHNLNGNLLNCFRAGDTTRYSYVIELTKSKEEKGFHLRILAVPQTDNIEEILGHYGWFHLLMRIRNVDGGYKIRQIDYLYGEI